MSADSEVGLKVVTDLDAIAEHIGADSELVQAGRLIRKRSDNILGLLLRHLSREEVAVLEDRGCHSDDWDRIQVAEDFNPFRVRRTHFIGDCVLGRFNDRIDLADGLSLPTGIYDSTLIDCQVGNNCLIEKVRTCANAVIEHEAVLFDVGTFSCSGAAQFGCGQALAVGVETGGREVPVWAELDIPAAAHIARNRHDLAGLEQVQSAVGAYCEAIRSPVCWLRRGAVVKHSERIRDAYIGHAAIVDHALEITNVTVLSNVEEPAHIGGGATVSDAIVQWGSHIAGHAIVQKTVLCEHAGVDENAVVVDSIIGPNTTIGKGEVTASLVGPFVGFHHQSLLIAAYWPSGRGNIAYGAMVGSNHTGRAPDQEVWPGEGMFFGLGCSIRFPSDFSAAPYSVVSAGVNTLAQRMAMPFSLIAQAVEPVAEQWGIPPAFNELAPGWGLYANAYGMERMELKLAKRDKARRHRFSYHVLRPSVIAHIRQALSDALVALQEEREFYTDEHLPGTGKNFIRHATLVRGVEAYRRTLRRYALRILLGSNEGKVTIAGSDDLAEDLLADLMPNTDLSTRLSELIAIEKANAEIVQASKAADDERGARIIPGYADAHTAAADDPVVQHAWRRVATTEKRVKALLG